MSNVYVLFTCVGALLLIPVYRLAIKGKFGRFRGSGFGNAVFHLHTLLRPSAQNIVEAKKQRTETTGQADDNPPELPPWAQSGN